LIIEDEELAADRLEARLKEINPDYKVLAKIGSVKQAVKWLQDHTADLIFLDIQLSDGLSFAIFEQVDVSTPIIFTTAYNQYAIKAFELNSVAYLLKPVRKSELELSLQKYRSMRSAFSIDFESVLSAYTGKGNVYKKRFLIRIGEKYTKLEASDIAYCFAMNKDVYAKTFSDRTLPMDYTLETLQQSLDPQQFFRINRKYLVNMEAITNMIALSRSRIKLALKPAPKDELDTIVSIQHAADFKNWIDT